MNLTEHYVVFSFRLGRFGTECEIRTRKRHPELISESQARDTNGKRIDFVVKTDYQEEARGLAKLVRKHFRDRHSNSCIYFSNGSFMTELFETVKSINKPKLDYDDIEELEEILDDNEFEIIMHDHNYAITLAPWDHKAATISKHDLCGGITENQMEEFVAAALGLSED